MDPRKLAKLNRAVPRYTSYPTAPHWEPTSADCYKERLGAQEGPLSLYLHIPFCRTMCLYCACSVVLNRRPEKEREYVDYLKREIELVAGELKSREVRQLHFGGGTPTQLSDALFGELFGKLESIFSIGGEVAIEIDPRTASYAKLKFLKHLGFNRVSFGVQDTNWKVQEAVRRRQSWEQTRQTYLWARELGFEGISLDLIYGLPFQTQQTFEETVSHILELRPDRIALFSYAKVPWIKPHQKAIKEETLPSTEEKFAIYAQAREQLIEGGYRAIGMDHFALPDDPFCTEPLQRNFQGYSLKLAEDLIGFGVTATGFVSGAYFQNVKELPDYYTEIEEGRLPILRGKVLTQEDQLRKWVIHRLMCDFVLHKGDFEQEFGHSFDRYFSQERSQLQQLVQEGLLEMNAEKLQPTLYGSLFIRNIASVFDSYPGMQYSRAI